VKKLLAVALAALAFPAVASAHATMEKATPSFAQRLEQSPTVVRLRFDQSVEALSNAIRVFDSKGRLLSGPVRSSADRRTIDAAVEHLPRGGYTVRWRVVSADSHVISGVYTFGVRHRAPPATEAFGAEGPTTTEHVVRWLYFLALALLAGGLGFRLLVVRGPL
jgi:copper transport protein